MRGDGGVAGEGRVVGPPKFHSWGKCTMPYTPSPPLYSRITRVISARSAVARSIHAMIIY